MSVGTFSNRILATWLKQADALVQVTKQMDKQMNHMRKRLVAVSIAGFMADTIDVESPFATSARVSSGNPDLCCCASALIPKADASASGWNAGFGPLPDSCAAAKGHRSIASKHRCGKTQMPLAGRRADRPFSSP